MFDQFKASCRTIKADECMSSEILECQIVSAPALVKIIDAWTPLNYEPSGNTELMR